MGLSRRRQGVAALARPVLAALLVAAVAGCTGSGVKSQSPPTGPSESSQPSATSTIDPNAEPAYEAYRTFALAATVAEGHPVGHDDPWPAGGDFTQASWDPFRAQFEEFIWSLKAQGVAYRGTPDVPHVRVKSVQLQAKPWPTVELTDCETGGKWNEYVISTGKKVPPAAGQKVKPPYLLTVKVILYQGRWGVMSSVADKSRTCVA